MKANGLKEWAALLDTPGGREALTVLFNEWMRQTLGGPPHEAIHATRRRFLTELEISPGSEPSYGATCARYAVRILRQEARDRARVERRI